MNTLRGFCLKELRQLLRDKRMRALLFLAPIFQLTIFGVALTNETKNIRLSIQAKPHDELAQIFKRRALASGWFIPVETDLHEDPFTLIRSGKVEAVLVTPKEGLTAAYLSQSDPSLHSSKPTNSSQLLIDTTNILRGQQIESYVATLLQLSLAERFPDWQFSPPAVNPFAVRILFNPAMLTSIYMVPGVMSLILCLLTILLTGMAITREKETGTFETLLSAPLSATEIILGKTVPFILLATLDSLVILLFAKIAFAVPLRGSLLGLLLAMFIFICTTVAIGTFISTISKTQEQAMLGSLLFLLPAVLFSGLMFPLENMPNWIRLLTYLNPLAYFIALQRHLMLKGTDLQIILRHLIPLMILGALLLAISLSRFKKMLR